MTCYLTTPSTELTPNFRANTKNINEFCPFYSLSLVLSDIGALSTHSVPNTLRCQTAAVSPDFVLDELERGFLQLLLTVVTDPVSYNVAFLVHEQPNYLRVALGSGYRFMHS